MSKTYISTSDTKTQEVGANFSRKLKPGDTVLLYGDLGAGKTTFVKGVAKGLGVKSRIISPTFTIIRKHNNTHHIDLYRIEKSEQLRELGINEMLEDQSFIKLIEWPEKLPTLPEKRIEVRLTVKNDDTRTINIDVYD